MNWLRNIVSGKRRRFKDKKFDLDITYITPRVLAMSFPASGIEALYRNNIKRVADFLEAKHGKNYRVYNFSARKYDEEKFGFDAVVSFEWKDHHSPAIHILFQACKDMYAFLSADPRNVAVCHCNAGKGRTGTAICCFLIFSGLAKNAEDAIKYYGLKRFSSGRGVTQPS